MSAEGHSNYPILAKYFESLIKKDQQMFVLGQTLPLES